MIHRSFSRLINRCRITTTASRFSSSITSAARVGTARTSFKLLLTVAGFGFACVAARPVLYSDSEGEITTISANITSVVAVQNTLSPSEFSKKMQSVEAEFPGKPIFVIFFAEKTNGISWCPDCRRAEPVVAAALEQLCPNSVLVVFNVKRSEYKNLPDYSYKQEPIFVKSVPTFSRL
jgi:thiol-disulfide isomerase/thioredoxin